MVFWDAILITMIVIFFVSFICDFPLNRINPTKDAG